MSDRLLVLVRHGQSEWNWKSLFTGWKDVDLTEAGVAEARAAGRKLKGQGLAFDVAYTSALKRAQRTLDLILAEMGQTGIPIVRDQALNERDYGDLVAEELADTLKLLRIEMRARGEVEGTLRQRRADGCCTTQPDCAHRRPQQMPQVHSCPVFSASLPGLTRQSILFAKNLAKMDGCAGQARA